MVRRQRDVQSSGFDARILAPRTKFETRIAKFQIETATGPTDAHSFLPNFEFRNSNFDSSVADAAFGRLITFARVNLVFLLFTFLIDDTQRTAVGSNEFHFYFVEFAVLPAAGR